MAPIVDADNELLTRYAASDPEAFVAFYRSHLSQMPAFFWRRTGDRELTADLTVEVFASALIAADDGTLKQALARLPTGQRDAVLARVVQERSYAGRRCVRKAASLPRALRTGTIRAGRVMIARAAKRLTGGGSDEACLSIVGDRGIALADSWVGMTAPAIRTGTNPEFVSAHGYHAIVAIEPDDVARVMVTYPARQR